MSSTGSVHTKPSKPYPSFPLTAHNNGQWCKKIRGKVHFFGVWTDPQAALDSYLQAAADLHAGRQPSSATLPSDTLTVKDVCNHYLTHQLQRVEAGEIGCLWFDNCRCTIQDFARYVGSGRPVCHLAPDDFRQYRHKLATKGLSGKKGLGVHALNRSITIVRGMFSYAYELGLIELPMKYGGVFDRPSATLKRKSRIASERENGKQLFQASEILSMINAAGEAVRAAILLAINGGLGGNDCACLPLVAVHLEEAVLEFDRPKTSIERVVPLWPETVEALRKALSCRPKPIDSEAEKLVFLSKHGSPWIRQTVYRKEGAGIDKVVVSSDLRLEFDAILRRLGLKRKRIGFYTLRHTFRTWADESRDQHAIHRIMGHSIPGMSGVYVERIELSRLRAVVEIVRAKLFGSSKDNGPETRSPVA